MSQPYYGEIRMFAGNFAPRSWAFCNGQLLAISQNDALYTLLGTTYGGDGQQTFALPDLRGRLAIGQGQGPGLTTRTIAETGGTESVTLTVNQLPSHSHPVNCNTDAGTSSTPVLNFWAANADVSKPQYAATSNANMNGAQIAMAGGNQPHGNLMPYLGINFIIALEGLYPSQN